MEKIMHLIVENWSTILEYLMMFLAYFFVFLYRNKSINTSNLLKTEYKTVNANLSEKYRENLQTFNDRCNELESMKQMLLRHDEVLQILIDTEVKIDGSTDDGGNQ